MKPTYKIIVTEDGSHTLYRPDLNETYHSTRGALNEGKHVFIEAGINTLWGLNEKIAILEIGFGTGLNAALTQEWANNHSKSVLYKSLEPFPIPQDILKEMNYASFMPGISTLQKLELNSTHSFPFFEIQILREKLEDFHEQSNYFHGIYFDAFAPSKQAEVWSVENLKRCYEVLKKGGFLVTYCAQGQFKRNLISVGFEIEILPGPAGKKEMVRAWKGK